MKSFSLHIDQPIAPNLLLAADAERYCTTGYEQTIYDSALSHLSELVNFKLHSKQERSLIIIQKKIVGARLISYSTEASFSSAAPGL